ncbi:MAG: DUF4167 domain-containing protein [Pseudomonadota bacterium]
MRPGQSNKRSRGRGRKGPSPLSRSHESNGPDVKIRGTAQHIADKYINLARDAQSSGDTVLSEAYFQHAEHYYRIVAAAQQQMNQPVSVKRADDPLDADEGDEREGFDPSDPSAPQPEMQSGANGADHSREGGDGEESDRRPRRGRGRSRRPRGDDPRRSMRDDEGGDRSPDAREAGAENGHDAVSNRIADDAALAPSKHDDTADSEPRTPRRRKAAVAVSDRFAEDGSGDGPAPKAEKPQPVSFGDEVPTVQAAPDDS